MLELRAVRVDDRHRDDRHEAVEHVELGRLTVLAGDHPDAERDLYEHRQLDCGGEPPQRPGPQRDHLVRGERPQAGEPVTDDHHPGPAGVDADEQRGEQGSSISEQRRALRRAAG